MNANYLNDLLGKLPQQQQEGAYSETPSGGGAWGNHPLFAKFNQFQQQNQSEQPPSFDINNLFSQFQGARQNQPKPQQRLSSLMSQYGGGGNNWLQNSSWYKSASPDMQSRVNSWQSKKWY